MKAEIYIAIKPKLCAWLDTSGVKGDKLFCNLNVLNLLSNYLKFFDVATFQTLSTWNIIHHLFCSESDSKFHFYVKFSMISEMKFWFEPPFHLSEHQCLLCLYLNIIYILELPLFFITWRSSGSFPMSPVCSLSVTYLYVCVCDYVPVLDYCSIPTHMPQPVTVHTAVARVPSPTLVCSTLQPYRYTAHACARTHQATGVWLTWLIFTECCSFTTA